MSTIGVSVVEVDGLAPPVIQPAATSVGAFIGRAERGVPDRAVRVSDPTRFQDRFGGYRADSYLAYTVDGFFANGGREAYIVRVVGTGSLPAVATLNDRQGVATPTLRLQAGYRGDLDPGPWGNRMTVDVQDDARAVTNVVSSTVATAVVDSVEGLEVGSVVRLVDAAAVQQIRKLTSVNPATNQIGWTGNITGGLTALSEVRSLEFRLLVMYRPQATDPPRLVEDWRRLSMETDVANYVVARLNHPFTGSRYVLATDLSGTTGPGVENPGVASAQTFGSGTDNTPTDLQFSGSSAMGTGLHAFDRSEVQLVAVPDVHRLTATQRDLVLATALDYCEQRSDCMLVCSTPNRGAPGGVVPRRVADFNEIESAYALRIQTYANGFHRRKAFGAMYTPWIQVSDPLATGPSPTLFVPPEGHVMGVYARTELERILWKAPAGVEALVRGARAAAAEFTDGQHTDLVEDGLVNGIRPTPGYGIVIAASRTLSTDTRWWFVNVRLLFNFVKSSLRSGLRFVRQEPHSEELRRSVKFNVVTPFLLGLWRRGAFGSDPAEMVFSVKCDAENNPPNEVDLGNFRVEVYFYPVKPAETVVIVVGQQPSGSVLSES
jgi:uncharacterized protein